MNRVDREILSAVRATEVAERLAIKEFVATVNTLRERVILALADSETISAATANTVKARIEQITRDFNNRLSAVMTDNQRRMFVRGIQVIDRAVKSAGLRSAVPYLDETIQKQLQGFGARLVSDLTADARRRIAQEIDLAMLGQKPITDVIRAIGTKLGSPSVFGTIGRRAEIIMRTEANRINQLASAERLAQFHDQIPNLRKQWLHAHVGLPRANHLALDGVVVPADGTFTLVAVDGSRVYHVDSPYDPTLPAAETINCRCKVIPFIG